MTDTKTEPGIVYLSRIPPGMNPLKIRTLLSQYGTVGRLFLQPEDPSVRKRRKKSGGNTRKQFTEGWVEYEDKKIAKSVAQTLNNTNFGGKKRYFYHDDIWNIRYLNKFKWVHISEKLAYEKAAREQRMRTEIAQVKRETNAFLENVDKGKEIMAIEKKKKKRKIQLGSSDNGPDEKKCNIFQKPVIDKQKSGKMAPTKTSYLNKSLLSKILTNS